MLEDEFGMHYSCIFATRRWLEPEIELTLEGLYLTQRPHHFEGKSDNDVQGFMAVRTTYYLPRGLNNIFPNLVRLTVKFKGLKKINRGDLVGLESLEILELSGNKLVTLPNDLFADMKKLRAIDFSHNNLGCMSSKLLKPVRCTLESARFNENTTINVRFKLGTTDTWAKLIKAIDEIHEAPIGEQALNHQQDTFWNTLFEAGQLKKKNKKKKKF